MKKDNRLLNSIEITGIQSEIGGVISDAQQLLELEIKASALYSKEKPTKDDARLLLDYIKGMLEYLKGLVIARDCAFTQLSEIWRNVSLRFGLGDAEPITDGEEE